MGERPPVVLTRRQLSRDALGLLASLSALGTLGVAQAHGASPRALATRHARTFGALVDAIHDVPGAPTLLPTGAAAISALSDAYQAAGDAFHENVDAILSTLVTGSLAKPLTDGDANTFGQRERRSRLDIVRSRLLADNGSAPQFSGDPSAPLQVFPVSGFALLALEMVASFDRDDFGRSDASVLISRIRVGGY